MLDHPVLMEALARYVLPAHTRLALEMPCAPNVWQESICGWKVLFQMIVNCVYQTHIQKLAAIAKMIVFVTQGQLVRTEDHAISVLRAHTRIPTGVWNVVVAKRDNIHW